MRQVKIREGAKIFQDHWFFTFPNLMGGGTADPNTIFTVIGKTDRHTDCVADGHGALPSNGVEGKYGSGSIFVLDPADLIEVLG